jgi:hypothetical protein
MRTISDVVRRGAGAGAMYSYPQFDTLGEVVVWMTMASGAEKDRILAMVNAKLSFDAQLAARQSSQKESKQ